MPWNYPGGYPSPSDFFSLLQQAKFQLPGRNYSPLPPPYSPAPQGSLDLGASAGHPPGGYTGGYPLPPSAGGTPPSPGIDWSAMARAGLGALVPGGGAAPGAADIARSLAASGNAGQPTPLPGLSGNAALGALPGLLAGGGANMGASGGQAVGGWTPATAVPPNMAQTGLPSTSGLLGALWGNPRQPPPLTYGDWTTPKRAAADTKPLPADKTITDLRPPSGPTGATGQGAVTGAKLKTVRPQEGNTPQAKQPDQSRYTSKPAAKAKPRAKVQPRQGTQWETGERGAPVGGQFSGGFGYQAWRRPKR